MSSTRISTSRRSTRDSTRIAQVSRGTDSREAIAYHAMIKSLEMTLLNAMRKRSWCRDGA